MLFQGQFLNTAGKTPQIPKKNAAYSLENLDVCYFLTVITKVVEGYKYFNNAVVSNMGFWVAQWKRIHLPMQEMWVPTLGQGNSLEKEMATHSGILAWEIPWIEEPGGLRSMGLQKSRTQFSN